MQWLRRPTRLHQSESARGPCIRQGFCHIHHRSRLDQPHQFHRLGLHVSHRPHSSRCRYNRRRAWYRHMLHHRTETYGLHPSWMDGYRLHQPRTKTRITLPRPISRLPKGTGDTASGSNRNWACRQFGTILRGIPFLLSTTMKGIWHGLWS